MPQNYDVETLDRLEGELVNYLNVVRAVKWKIQQQLMDEQTEEDYGLCQDLMMQLDLFS